MATSTPVRRFALELLELAERSTHPLGDLLERKGLELEAAGGGRDLGLLRHLVLGTLRQRSRIDALLAAVSRRPLGSLEPQLLNLLRLGAFQLLPGSHIPPHAAVDQSVRLAKRLGHAGTGAFANGILRSLARRLPSLLEEILPDEPSARLGVATSHPAWLVERWIRQLGLEAAKARCEANNLEPPIDLRIFGPPAEALRWLDSQGIACRQLDTPLGLRLAEASDLPRALVGEGLRRFYVQSRLSQRAADLAASLALESLQRTPEGIVLDACAAPGGKTLAIAQRLPPAARLIAHDVNARRNERMLKNFERLAPRPIELTEDPESLRSSCAFVLVDAPCSALGVIRRHPEIRWRRQPEDPARMQTLQLEIVERFATCLAPGGLLLYSVCSFEPEETLQALEHLLRSGALEAHPAHPPLLSTGAEDGEDGFFMAALRRPC